MTAERGTARKNKIPGESYRPVNKANLRGAPHGIHSVGQHNAVSVLSRRKPTGGTMLPRIIMLMRGKFITLTSLGAGFFCAKSCKR